MKGKVKKLDNRMQETLNNAKLIKEYIDRISQLAFEILQNGGKVKGWGIGFGRGVRQWIDADEGVKSLSHLKEDDLYVTSLKSVAELEKIVGKQNLADFGLYETHKKRVLKPEKELDKQHRQETVDAMEML